MSSAGSSDQSDLRAQLTEASSEDSDLETDDQQIRMFVYFHIFVYLLIYSFRYPIAICPDITGHNNQYYKWLELSPRCPLSHCPPTRESSNQQALPMPTDPLPLSGIHSGSVHRR